MVADLVMAAAEFTQAHHSGLQLGFAALSLAIKITQGVRWVVRRGGKADLAAAEDAIRREGHR